MNTANDGALNIEKREQLWQRPWLWMILGLLLTAIAFVWAQITGSERIPLEQVQVPLVLFGVFSCGISLWLRTSQSQPASLNDLGQSGRSRALMILAATHIALAIAISVWVVLKINDPNPTTPEQIASALAGSGGARLPGDFIGTLVLWLFSVPWCIYSAHQLWLRAKDSNPVSDRIETAVLTTQAGLALLFGSWALYWGKDVRGEWDSVRTFLGAGAGFALLSAAIVAASTPIRRLAVSCLVILHFAGIIAVAVGTPPGPWILAQTQHWVFRPYLDFMYLNNAYRFYSPEPGPASQLWFRIEYDHGGQVLTHWSKLPDINDLGQHKYPMSLQYTRRLALTENIARTGMSPPMMEPNALGEMVPAAYVSSRIAHTPMSPDQVKVGQFTVKNSLGIPMHPELPLNLNHQPPTPDGERILASFARHILQKPHPDPKFADAKPMYVKIYRVQHRILSAEEFARGYDPRDWITFFPYYMGKFDAQGQLVDPNDPFRYWLLPIVRDRKEDRSLPLKCYVFKHAGESEWILTAPPAWAR